MVIMVLIRVLCCDDIYVRCLALFRCSRFHVLTCYLTDLVMCNFDLDMMWWCVLPFRYPNRRFCKDMTANGLEKKSNYEQLEWVFRGRVCLHVLCVCLSMHWRVWPWFGAIVRQVYGGECVCLGKQTGLPHHCFSAGKMWASTFFSTKSSSTVWRWSNNTVNMFHIFFYICEAYEY